jgi:hypothetical protein
MPPRRPVSMLLPSVLAQSVEFAHTRPFNKPQGTRPFTLVANPIPSGPTVQMYKLGPVEPQRANISMGSKGLPGATIWLDRHDVVSGVHWDYGTGNPAGQVAAQE